MGVSRPPASEPLPFLPGIARHGNRAVEGEYLLDTGAHSVLRVQRPGLAEDAAADTPADASPEAAERLIPFVAAYIDDVSLADQRITVDWGLDY